MIFIYFKVTGEIFQASLRERNLEEFFGTANLEEVSKVFDFIIMDYNNFIFYNFHEFHVVNGKLKLKDENSGLKSIL